MIGLHTGARYRVDLLRLVGWTDAEGSGAEGSSLADYFESDGTYRGEDENGIEPLVEYASPPMRWLHEDLLNTEIEDAGDACVHLGKAARLAALGDDSWWRHWDSRRAVNRPGLVDELVKRARLLRHDLRNATGALLGRALIDAADLYILLTKDAEETPRRLFGTAVAIASMAADAEEVVLDDEAAAEVRAWMDLYPIPDEYRLEVMHEPLGDAERAILAALPAVPATDLRTSEGGAH